MNVEIRDPRFVEVVGDDVVVEQLATGFDFTEGPIWHHRDSHLIFSDMPGNRIRRWTADAGIETFRYRQIWRMATLMTAAGGSLPANTQPARSAGQITTVRSL